MFLANLITLAALDSRIIVIHIVKLYLDNLNLRVLCQNLFQNIRRIMEGDTEVSEFPLCFQFQSSFIGFTAFEESESFGVLRVHEVEIKIVHTTGCKLLFKKRANIFLFFEKKLVSLSVKMYLSRG